MAKQGWDNFTKAHPNAPALIAALSSSLPKGVLFDKNGLKLPTPYGLLTQWLKGNLSDDWTSTIKNGVVFVKVANAADEATIVKQFPAVGTAKKTPASARTIQISYADGNYEKLATALGYILK